MGIVLISRCVIRAVIRICPGRVFCALFIENGFCLSYLYCYESLWMYTVSLVSGTCLKRRKITFLGLQLLKLWKLHYLSYSVKRSVYQGGHREEKTLCKFSLFANRFDQKEHFGGRSWPVWLVNFSSSCVGALCPAHGLFQVFAGIQHLSLYVTEESEHRLQVVVGAGPSLFMSVAIYSSISCEMLNYCTG